MQGAHERNTLRWDIHRALLDQEIERLERALANQPEDEAATALRKQLEEAQHRRRALGPAPRPKMG